MEKRAESACDLLEEIYALAHILRLVFEQTEALRIRVNPHAVARFGDMIAANAIRISEIRNEKAKANKNKDAACQSERPAPS